jgi:imidazoleglycerol-phosphate dehydratase
MATNRKPTRQKAVHAARSGGSVRSGKRHARVSRATKETEISIELNLDGTGQSHTDTGVPFLNHMLEIFARHGFFDLSVRAHGDLDVDQHHTVEDVGLALGQALREALGDKVGIRRFGNASCPLDEALVSTVVDLSGRPFLSYNLRIKQSRVGVFDTELVHDFFLALSNQAGMNLHFNQVQGRNAHHIIEAAFKSFARALDEAKQIDPRVKGVPSTKGSLDG